MVGKMGYSGIHEKAPRGCYPSISLFTGAYGLDLGLERAGFEIRACVEKNPFAVQTILRNRPQLAGCVLQEDVRNVSAYRLLKIAGLRRGEAALVSGGPPCQPFSTIGRRRSVSTEDGTLFQKFLDLVWGIKPTFFVFENVKGIISAALRHQPLENRKNAREPRGKKVRLGSAWDFIRGCFDKTLRRDKKYGYHTYIWELNAADFGTAQVRKRVFIVGSRNGYALEKPIGRFASCHRPIRNVISHLDGGHETLGVDYRPYDAVRAHIFTNKLVKPGENWRVLPKMWQKKVMGAAYYSWGGRVGFARRISWDNPCPTITTDPRGRATNLCHPTKARPFTTTECALLQGYPEDWQFEGSLTQRYIQIGNAVPVELGEGIGRSLINWFEEGCS